MKATRIFALFVMEHYCKLLANTGAKSQSERYRLGMEWDQVVQPHYWVWSPSLLKGHFHYQLSFPLLFWLTNSSSAQHSLFFFFVCLFVFFFMGNIFKWDNMSLSCLKFYLQKGTTFPWFLAIMMLPLSFFSVAASIVVKPGPFGRWEGSPC